MGSNERCHGAGVLCAQLTSNDDSVDTNAQIIKPTNHPIKAVGVYDSTSTNFSPMASLLTVSKAKRPIPGRYIITLKEDVSLAAHVSSTQASIASTTSNITHELDIINGYAGEFTESDLDDLRANPEIDSIEEDGISRTCYETQSVPLPTRAT